MSAAGATSSSDATADIMTVNGGFNILVIVRCTHTQAGSPRRRMLFDAGLLPGISAVIGMGVLNREPLDRLLFALADIGTGKLHLPSDHGTRRRRRRSNNWLTPMKARTR